MDEKHTKPTQTVHTHTHTRWAAKLKQLSAVQFGKAAGVPNQASNKIKRKEIEARSDHRRHSVWPKHKQTLAAFCTDCTGCILLLITAHIHK